MLLQNFRTAAQELGKYCSIKNELLIRKDSKVYRFTCFGKGELRFAAPALPEVVIALSSDATVPELKRGVPLIIDSHETPRVKC